MPKDTWLQRYKERFYNMAQRLRGGLVCLWIKSMTWVRRWGSVILRAIWNAVREAGEQLRRRPSLFVGIIALVLFILFILSLWKLPAWQVAGATLTDKERLELIDKARGTIAQIWAGIVVLVGLGFTWYRIEVAREGQITERFTRAIDQLGATDESGNKRLELRLGGIYALERIARDSEKDHWPIMEVLTAYVRENAPWKENAQPQDSAAPSSENATQQQEPQGQPAPDIQAILTVLGRRTRWYGKGENHPLDLHGTDIRGATLTNAHLEGAYLHRVHLEGADLRGAHGLTREQLAVAYTDENTLLPDYLTSSQATDDEDT
jgi:hypothetical protein